MNFDSLKLMKKESMVNGFPTIDHSSHLCEGCLFGKQAKKKSFPKESLTRAGCPLELIHMDVCGPINPSSLDKSDYFLFFIDDFSRKIWVYFLKVKLEVIDTFKKFKSTVKNKVAIKLTHCGPIMVENSPQMNSRFFVRIGEFVTF